MGKSYTPVIFADTEIKINPHSATKAEHLRPITLGEFAGVGQVKVSKCDETGEYLFERGYYGVDYQFVEGPEC